MVTTPPRTPAQGLVTGALGCVGVGTGSGVRGMAARRCGAGLWSCGWWVVRARARGRQVRLGMAITVVNVATASVTHGTSVEAGGDAPDTAGHTGGDVQEPVAQRFGLARFESVGQGEQP